MHIKSVYILIGALLLTLCINVQRANGQAIVPKNITIPNDSLDEEMFLKGDTALKTRENKAKNDSLYILDIPNKRYHARDEDFAKAWHDHLFMVVGAGTELMQAPSKDHRFSPMTTAHIGIGKQFNERHALRLTINGGFGTHENNGHLFARLGGRIDHMFNVSSFFDGYHPARTLNVSTLLGAGYHYSRIKNHNSSKSLEGHAGLQFRFFTGPKGYINIEPYIGIAQDAYDLSEARNWRKYDVFYGINASYVHYLHSNLSREKRNEYLNAYKVAKTYEKLAPEDTTLNDSLRKIFATEYDELKKSNFINKSLRNVLAKRYNAAKGDTLFNDSLLKSWQTPFFLEISNGVSMMKSPNLDYVGTTGHNLMASLGKWFSPAIGLRMSLSSVNFTWKKEYTPESLSPVRPSYTNKMHSMMFGIGAEAMINPLGFVKNYNWDKKAGFHFLFGGELGWILKEQSGEKNLSCHTEAYTAGVQIWCQLYDGLHLFVEPRYASYNYRLPYSNVHKHKSFSDETFSVNLGISMQLRSRDFLEKDARNDANFHESKISVGLGGGITLMSTKSHYKGDNTLKWNASAHGTYRFDHYSGARLSLEYLSMSDNIMSAYTDYNMELPEIDYAQTTKSGLWKRTFHIGIISADYVLHLTNLFSNHKKSWDLEAFVGPSFAMILGESGEMFSGERRQPNHKYKVKDKVGFENYWGANGGISVSYRPKNSSLSFYLSPTFYLFKEFDLPASMTRNFTLIETINAGVQYSF